MDFVRHKYSVWTQTPVHPNVDTKFQNADTDADTDVGTDIKNFESQTRALVGIKFGKTFMAI